MSEPNLHMPRIPHGSPRYQEGYSEGYRKAVQDTKADNDRLRARVAELKGFVRDIAKYLPEEVNERIREVLAKGRAG